MAVPRIIHQVWLGPAPVQRSVESWRHCCDRHGWEYYLWRDEQVEQPGFLKWDELYRRCADNREYHYRLKSDVIRVELLKRFGGFYVDCDIEASGQSIEEFVPLAHVDFVGVPDYRDMFFQQYEKDTKYVRLPDSEPQAIAILTGFMGASLESKTIASAHRNMQANVDLNGGRIDFYTIACPYVSTQISEAVYLIPNELVFFGPRIQPPPVPQFPHIARRTEHS